MKLARQTTALLLLLPACAPEFERQSELSSVRVLAVQKDLPYARPGETVTLTMLDVDASENAGTRPLERLWLAGCENPPSDSYAACGERFAAGAVPQLGSGARFSFQMSPDIITDHGPPNDPDQPPYGVAYVFFAACAGRLALAPEEDRAVFPYACYSENDRPLGAEHFVAGYTAVYAYESFRNANPIVTGFEVRGRRIAHDCIGVECVEPDVVAPSDGGAPGDGGMPVDAGPDGALAEGGVPDAGSADLPDAGVGIEICDVSPARCVDVCEAKDEDKCPDIPIRPMIDPMSAEIDAALAAGEQTEPLEQMWVNYYVDRGSLSSEVRLLNDSITGWNEDYGTDFRAPKEPGPVRIWAAAHDNRGGVQWVRVTLYARRR